MISRINLILKTKNLTPAQLAEQVGVQRSNISHLLSGRNNPSLDFVQKILIRFPDINSDWLLFGKGAMYKDAGQQSARPEPQPSQQNMLSFFDQPTPLDNNEEPYTFEEQLQELPKHSTADNKNFIEHPILKKNQNTDIERIIIMFNDGSCKVYNI